MGSVNGQSIDTAVLTTSTQQLPGKPKDYYVSASGTLTGKANTQYTGFDVTIEYFSTDGTTDTLLVTQTINLPAGSGTINYQAPAAFRLNPNPPAGDKVFAKVTVVFKPANGANVTKTKETAKATFPW
jgi:hypothetical protein